MITSFSLVEYGTACTFSPARLSYLNPPCIDDNHGSGYEMRRHFPVRLPVVVVDDNCDNLPVALFPAKCDDKLCNSLPQAWNAFYA